MWCRWLLISLAVLGGGTVPLMGEPCNTPPSVVPQSRTIDVGLPSIVDVLTLAVDPDGQALTVALVSDTCPGQVSVVVDPTQTLTLFASAAAPDCQVMYQVSDGAGGTASTTLSLSFVADIFSDGFEQGSTAAWSDTVR